MAERARRLVAGPIGRETWAPFGWLPVPDTDPADGAFRLEFQWADPHVNVISHAPDEVEREGDGLRCDLLYRHDTHTQALLALNGPSVLAVAPADADLSTDRRASRPYGPSCSSTLDALVLHRGTWHWGPFPPGTSPCSSSTSRASATPRTTRRRTSGSAASTSWWWGADRPLARRPGRGRPGHNHGLMAHGSGRPQRGPTTRPAPGARGSPGDGCSPPPRSPWPPRGSPGAPPRRRTTTTTPWAWSAGPTSGTSPSPPGAVPSAATPPAPRERCRPWAPRSAP